MLRWPDVVGGLMSSAVAFGAFPAVHTPRREEPMRTMGGELLHLVVNRTLLREQATMNGGDPSG